MKIFRTSSAVRSGLTDNIKPITPLTTGAAPLVPYFLVAPSPGAFQVSLALSVLALAALGLLRWRVTNETVTRCVGETLLVGGICGLVAYGVGLLFA